MPRSPVSSATVGGEGVVSEGASGLPIRVCGGVNSHGVHFDISDGVVKKKSAQLSALMHL